MKKTVFAKCKLHEADFTETDLSLAVFAECDLTRAIFENTNLEKTDLRTAFNFSIDPSRNKVKKAKFSASGLSGLLGRFDLDIE
jgi:uncharacterized protein YjbI with pentapeptide repeats